MATGRAPANAPRASNLDATGMRVVRKGVSVRLARCSIRVGRVELVRLGECLVALNGGARRQWWPCREWEVVA